MNTLSQTLRTKSKKALLVGAVLCLLLPSSYAQAAEWEGTVLFFSVEDLQQTLFHPSHPWRLSFSQLLPSFAWQEQPKTAEQDGPLERNARWGNGLGVDGYPRPGTRPLWGY